MNLFSIIKAGAVAAALSIGALAATMPANAAPPPPNFGFSLHFGNGYGGPGVFFNYGDHPHMMCLSDRQIYWQLQQSGWDHVRIVKTRDTRVIAVASWHHQWYQLLVDRCSGHITQRPVSFHGNNWNGPITNFGITLNF